MTDTELPEMVRSLLGPTADPVAAGTTLQRIAALPPESLAGVLRSLRVHADLLGTSDPAVLGGLLLALQRMAAGGSQEAMSELDVPAIATIDDHLPPGTPNRFRLLYLLAAARTESSLRLLADRLTSSPPGDWTEVGQVLSPLLKHHQNWPTAAFFPSILSGLHHPSVASPVLDLANFLFRKKITPQHPAADRRESLSELLGAVAGRLGRFEDNPRVFGDSVDEVQRVLSEAVALAVSLCDALGLIGWEGASGKLYQAMELAHRRVQTEAAGALARMGVADGRQRLIALAAEPSARLRVITYAEELGIGEKIDEAYKTDEALAEAELALWLSQPPQMGVPPTHVEVIDRRTQFWPSFERPVDCFLVRFEYSFGDRQYSNIGITGPLVHAASADLADLPSDDIYAVYAGWQAEHEDIFLVDAAHWNAAQKRLARPRMEALDRMGFESIKPVALGFFLDEHAAIATATRDETECIVITDGLETIDFAIQGRSRPLGAADLWNLYLGRKMLRTFNR